MHEIDVSRSRLARLAPSSYPQKASGALRRMRREASALTTAAQESARRQIDRRRAAAARTLGGWAEAIDPQAARSRSMGGRGSTTLLIGGAVALGVAIGYALRSRLEARAAKRAEQATGPSGEGRLDAESAAALAAAEAMDTDYRERARAGSDL